MEIYQLESPLEDALFGGEAPFNPAFSNELFAEALKVSKKTLKARRTGSKSQAAKPASRPAKLAAQSIVQWQYVSLRQLRSRPGQPRQIFDPVTLSKLAASVQSRGILDPLLVREIADPSSAEAVFEVIAGERRWRASQAAGLTQVPVLVQHLDDKAASEIALIENILREDLTPLETASALVQMTQQGYSVRKLAVELGKEKGWVEQHLRLTRLSEELKEMVSGRPDAVTHARELEKVSDPMLQAKLIAKVRDENLSLSELRRQIRHQAGAAPKAQRAHKDKEQENIMVKGVLKDGIAEESAVEKSHAENLENPAPQNPISTDAAPSLAADAVVASAPGEETASMSVTLEEAMAPEQPTALPQLVQLEAGEAEETGCREMNGVATGETTRHQSDMKAKLRILLRDLDKLERPAGPAILTEMTQLLQEAQEALTVTLELWTL